MHLIHRIQAIECRGGLIGRSLHQLCDEAKEDFGLFRAWSKGRPYVSRVFDRACGKVEAVLDGHEARIFVELAHKFLTDDVLARLGLPQGEPGRVVTGLAPIPVAAAGQESLARCSDRAQGGGPFSSLAVE